MRSSGAVRRRRLDNQSSPPAASSPTRRRGVRAMTTRVVCVSTSTRRARTFARLFSVDTNSTVRVFSSGSTRRRKLAPIAGAMFFQIFLQRQNKQTILLVKKQSHKLLFFSHFFSIDKADKQHIP
eukprot:PhM_4_TR4897/c0_g1_i1/m.90629